MHNQTMRQDASPQLLFRGAWQAKTTAASPVTSIAVDTGRDVVATASADDDVTLWHISGQMITRLPSTCHAGLALSPLGSLLATASAACPPQVWSLPNGALMCTCSLLAAYNSGDDEAVTAFAWHPTDTALFLGAQSGRIYTWRLDQTAGTQESEVSHLTMPDVAITALLVSPQGNWLAIGRRDGVLGLATLETSPHQLLYPGHHQGSVGAFHTGKGFFLISQSLGEPICRIWEPGGISPSVREWRLADRMSAGTLYPLVVDPLERWSFSAATLGAVQPWRHWRWPPEDQLPSIIPLGVSSDDHSTPVTVLATDAHGDLLIAGDLAGRIWLWDVQPIPAS